MTDRQKLENLEIYIKYAIDKRYGKEQEQEQK